jgi:hypothetical protein
MEICVPTSTRETTLLSRAVLPSAGAVLCPQTALTSAVVATAGAGDWRARQIAGVNRTGAPAAAFQGGAIAGLGMAFVTDHMVTDHKYSTRLGSPSCSPPV